MNGLSLEISRTRRAARKTTPAASSRITRRRRGTRRPGFPAIERSVNRAEDRAKNHPSGLQRRRRAPATRTSPQARTSIAPGATLLGRFPSPPRPQHADGPPPEGRSDGRREKRAGGPSTGRPVPAAQCCGSCAGTSRLSAGGYSTAQCWWARSVLVGTLSAGGHAQCWWARSVVVGTLSAGGGHAQCW